MTDDAKVRDRLAKLLAIATHPTTNPNEASNARAAAEDLAREHGITLDAFDDGEPFIYVVDDDTAAVWPHNPVTAANYSGGNVARLLRATAARGYGSGEWAGYGQWREAGRQVRKGEKGATIVRPFTVRDDDTGEKTIRFGLSRVFHLDQTDAVPDAIADATSATAGEDKPRKPRKGRKKKGGKRRRRAA